jgi:rfaE bifunctional protein kinase chain/domain
LKVDKVLVPGKFEVIHSGHMRLFKTGKDLGKKIIVALDIDKLSTEEISWRLELLKGINQVDEIETFNSDISNLLLKIKPNIVLKGKEFESLNNPESKYLDSFGGRLLFSSGSAYFSTNDLATNQQLYLKESIFENAQEFLKRNQVNKVRVKELLDAIKNVKTCVIGDLIIDEIISCHPIGMSQEDPAIVMTPIDSKRFIGGAGIVAAHSEALGSKTTFISVLGDDSTALWAESNLNSLVSNLVIIRDANRATNLKQRFRSGSQLLFRLNHFSDSAISKKVENSILDYFKKNVKSFNLLILSDFSFGVISESLAKSLITVAKENNIFVAADSQTSSRIGNLTKFCGSDLITPTEVEARLEVRDENCGLVVLAETIRKILSARNILLKLGADGVLLHGINKSGLSERTDQVPALNRSPIDLSGAGDSMLAASALALSSGEDIYFAAYIGSVMAAIQVSQLSNTPISRETVQEILLK